MDTLIPAVIVEEVSDVYVDYVFPHGAPAFFADLQRVERRDVMQAAARMPAEAKYFRFLQIRSGRAAVDGKHVGRFSSVDQSAVSPFYDKKGAEVPKDCVFKPSNRPPEHPAAS